VVGHKQRRGTKDRLWTKLLAAIEATGGSVSMASATFQLVQVPTIDVRLQRDERIPAIGARES
jgi:hypothetical protein